MQGKTEVTMKLSEVVKRITSGAEYLERNLIGNLKPMIARMEGGRGREDMEAMLASINRVRVKEGDDELTLDELVDIVKRYKK